MRLFFPLIFPNTVRHPAPSKKKKKRSNKPALGYCTLAPLAFVCSVISLQEVLYINMEIAMIYSELTLLPALTELLHLFQNKNKTTQKGNSKGN